MTAPLVERCGKKGVEVRAIKTSTYTHICKLQKGHDGEHKCICDRGWKGSEQ